MQRWEYCVVSFGSGRMYFHTAEGRRDQEIQDFAGEDGSTIGKLGNDGWELVGINDGSLYFKRPKAED